MTTVRKLGPSARAIAILAGAAAVAFAISTAAVSSASTSAAPAPAIAVKYHFRSFSFQGGVSTSDPSHPSAFSLSFSSSFELAANSPGIVNATTGTLDKVTVTERVSYPVPASKASAPLIGPAELPFSSEKLALVVAIKGACFVLQASSGAYVFQGGVRCVTATLTLGPKTYKVGSLVRSVRGSFTPPTPAAGGNTWNGSLTASFANPGYTFPVATLGSGGGTTLVIGSNGGSHATRSVSFAS